LEVLSLVAAASFTLDKDKPAAGNLE